MSDRHVCTDTCTSTAFCTELGNDLDYIASARTEQKLEQSVFGESCLHSGHIYVYRRLICFISLHMVNLAALSLDRNSLREIKRIMKLKRSERK